MIKKIDVFLFVKDFPYSAIVNQIHKIYDSIDSSLFMQYYIINMGNYCMIKRKDTRKQ